MILMIIATHKVRAKHELFVQETGLRGLNTKKSQVGIDKTSYGSFTQVRVKVALKFRLISLTFSG